MYNNIEEIEILLVDDDPGDVRLTQEALKESRFRNRIHVVDDGIEALEFLRQQSGYADAPRPDIILLDLNMPRMDGREVLKIIKSDDDLKRIPVVVLTTSESDEDVLASYDLHANCYIAKPVDLNQFVKIVKTIEGFWFSIVKLPRS
jgi:chemotaxis family two-component system response regulator Rcp1